MIVGSIPPKTESSNLYGFELQRPSIKGTSLFQVIEAIIIVFYVAHKHTHTYTNIYFLFLLISLYFSSTHTGSYTYHVEITPVDICRLRSDMYVTNVFIRHIMQLRSLTNYLLPFNFHSDIYMLYIC